MHEDGHEFVFVLEGQQTFEIDGVGTKGCESGRGHPHAAKRATLWAQRHRQNFEDPGRSYKAKRQPMTTEVKRD
jgi:hypothetical protein